MIAWARRSPSLLMMFAAAAMTLFRPSSPRVHRNMMAMAFQNHPLRPHYHHSFKRESKRFLMSSSNSNQVIQSTKSTTVKKIQALLNKRKKRLETGSTIVEGPRMVMDLLDNPKTQTLVQQVLVSSERQDWIQQLQHYPNLQIREGTPQVLKACSDTMTPQGIVAVVSIPDFSFSLQTTKEYPLYLVLDGVSDPGNVGTLLRSCVAVGAAGVVLLPQCCDVWNPKAIRSAMGCTFQIPILHVESWREAQSLFKTCGVGDCNVYAATMDGGTALPSIPHYEVDWTTSPSALVIGSEGNGLSDTVREAVADGTIQTTHIPMEPGIESLNAAVCGSVVLFEYLRQCRTQTS